MAAIANGLDFLVAIARGQSTKTGASVDKAGMRNAELMSYAIFTFFWFVVWGKFSSWKFSAILTCASVVQCLGFLLLSLKVRGSKSVAGLSGKMLVLYILHLATRLTSTSLKNGYLPMDKTGDYMYQLVDFATLLLVVQLLYCVHKTYYHSYQEEHDTLPLLPMVGPCLVLALFVHGTFNKNFFFDTAWAFSMNLEIVVMLPQLWMMARMGGKVDTMTAHFVAMFALSTVLSFTFWWFNFKQLEKKGAWLAGMMIMVAQGLKLLLSGDFMYYYTLAWMDGTEVVLPDREGELRM
jgi:hypothetical protein